MTKFSPQLSCCSEWSHQCRANCGPETVDILLKDRRLQEFPEQLDALLEFRASLQGVGDHSGTGNADAIIRQFLSARKVAERHFYLTFYRLRRWLENHFEVEVSAESVSGTAGAVQTYPLNLGFREFDILLRASRHQFFEHTEDGIQFDQVSARIVRKAPAPWERDTQRSAEIATAAEV